MKVKPFKRQGLHRLECSSCDGYAYSTVAQLESVGMPSCACGAPFVPDRLELAQLLGATDAPCVLEYEQACGSIAHGQASHVARGRRVRDVTDVALERVERNRAAAARKRRLGAIAPAAEPLPF